MIEFDSDNTNFFTFGVEYWKMKREKEDTKIAFQNENDHNTQINVGSPHSIKRLNSFHRTIAADAANKLSNSKNYH